jgi:hypothetical protein
MRLLGSWEMPSMSEPPDLGVLELGVLLVVGPHAASVIARSTAQPITENQ